MIKWLEAFGYVDGTLKYYVTPKGWYLWRDGWVKKRSIQPLIGEPWPEAQLKQECQDYQDKVYGVTDNEVWPCYDPR